MVVFRILALAYALAALLIAPAWIAADELVPDAVPQAAEQVAPAPAPAAEPEEPDPAGQAAAPADERPAAVTEEAAAPDAPAKAAAKPRKKDAEPVARVAADGSVTISDFKFSPATITVNVGDTVTWTNQGPTVHTATANDGSFDTGTLNKGESGSATFSTAGTISYICTPHPNMKGTVVVKAAAAQSDGADSGGASEPTATTAGDDSGGLPATGGETLAIALLGLVTLGAGLLMRRRATR